MITHNPLTRRTLIQGAGALLCLPMLESFAGEKAAQNISKKLVYTGINFGVCPNWYEGDNRRDYFLKHLKTFKGHENDFTIFKNLLNPNARNAHGGTDTLLTSHDVSSTPGKFFQNAISCDQLAAQHLGKDTRYSSIALSSPESRGTALGGWGTGHSLSWNERGESIPAITRPIDLYYALFGGGKVTKEERLYLLQRKKSMMDGLVGEIKKVKKVLSKDDQDKIEQYTNSIRQIELELVREREWFDRPFPKATVKQPNISMASGSTQEFELMFSLMAAALQSGSTNVFSYRQASDGIIAELGFPSESHNLNHLRGDEDLKINDARDKKRMDALSKFFDQLKNIKELDGSTLFDNTITSFACGIAFEHRTEDLPIIIAGGKNCNLKQGQLITCDKETKLSNLWLTTLQAAGCPVEKFSDSDSNIAEFMA